eukprot:Gregarina_sp_Poly_1__77@NODE_1017_length_5352_cov_48_087228_g709_i0_p5_GENE_NODE_1017_length_5352_cov_48_087228_g709_i0NODE_1017_length_5352_cov_48_087228_g709_i0_p5_ORF_typecomplete_len120_score24_82Fmp27/PF10344_9/0_0075_NODE_1017_length_5352_cov_48_087228_g709_i035193878
MITGLNRKNKGADWTALELSLVSSDPRIVPRLPKLYFDPERRAFQATIALKESTFRLTETFPVVDGQYMAARADAIKWLSATEESLKIASTSTSPSSCMWKQMDSQLHNNMTEAAFVDA